MTDNSETPIPIACDMTGAVDTPEQRLAEYRRLFSDGLVGRERTQDGVRFRFSDRPGLAEWVRDLSDREHACCPFMFFDTTVHGVELWWDVSTIDDTAARLVLDGLYDLPDSPVETVDGLLADYAERGLEIVATGNGFRQAGANDETPPT